jgi:hypothetical protein
MITKSDVPQESKRTFSTRGQISEVSATLVTIRNAKNREGETGFSYRVDVAGANIKSYTGEALSLSDIKTNQEVVAKGQLTGDTIIAHTFIIFGELPPISELIATTTEDIATTTQELVPNIEEDSSTQDTASSTDSIIDTITDSVDGVIDRLTDTITSIVDTLTGTSTDPVIPQNPSDVATSTDDIQEEPIEDTASSTDTIPVLEESIEPEPELEPLVDEVIEEDPIVESIPETVSEPTNTEFQ